MSDHTDITTKKIDGDKYLTFTPNTITYAVAETSMLGRRIADAKVGVIFHTEYKGKTLETMQASFAPKLKLARSKDVWYDDANFKDVSGMTNMSGNETSQFDKEYELAKKSFTRSKRFYDKIDPELQALGKIYINSKIRVGTQRASYREFSQFVTNRHQEKVDKLTSERGKTRRKEKMNDVGKKMEKNASNFKDLFDLFQHLINLKNYILPTLNAVRGNVRTFVKTPNGFKVTAPEGYVSVDKLSNKAFKIVDRLEFSKNNFTVAKDWIK